MLLWSQSVDLQASACRARSVRNGRRESFRPLRVRSLHIYIYIYIWKKKHEFSITSSRITKKLAAPGAPVTRRGRRARPRPGRGPGRGRGQGEAGAGARPGPGRGQVRGAGGGRGRSRGTFRSGTCRGALRPPRRTGSRPPRRSARASRPPPATHKRNF